MKRRNTLFSNSRNLYADYLIKKSKEDLFDGEYDGKQFLSIMQSKVSYRVPKGYISWNKLVEIFTCVLIENIIEEKKPGLIGGAEIRNARSIMEWFDTKSPLFIVESSLIDVFVESKMTECDIDFFRNLLSGLDNLYPNLILLFPSNCAHLFHEYTGNVDYCVITYMTSDKPICKIDGNTLETNSCVHLSGITKKAKILDNLFITTNNDLQMDWNHTDELSLILFKIVAQCLLLIASKPELVITSDQIKSFNHETSGQGFQKPKYGEKVLYPRVLNLSYAEKKIRSDDNRIQRQGNHSPKSPHWRLGYEVNKPVGKMKGVPREEWERKRIKVAPYFVLGGDDKDNQTTTETQPK